MDGRSEEDERESQQEESAIPLRANGEAEEGQDALSSVCVRSDGCEDDSEFLTFFLQLFLLAGIEGFEFLEAFNVFLKWAPHLLEAILSGLAHNAPLKSVAQRHNGGGNRLAP